MSLDYWRNIEGTYPFQAENENDMLKLKEGHNPVNLSTLENSSSAFTGTCTNILNCRKKSLKQLIL